MTIKKFTPEVQDLFIQILEDTASPKQAAAACGISRTLAFEYKRNDLEFRRRWEQAIDVAMDALLDEAYRRACIGVEEPVIYQGKVSMIRDATTGEERPLTMRKHSDRLLEVMLKFRYGDQLADRLRVKVDDTGLSADALLKMSSEDRKALTGLLAKYKASEDEDEDDGE